MRERTLRRAMALGLLVGVAGVSGSAALAGCAVGSGSAEGPRATGQPPGSAPVSGAPTESRSAGRFSTSPAATPSRSPSITQQLSPVAPAPSEPAAGGVALAAARGRIVSALPGPAKVVALTFDAGADNAGAATVAATLRQYRVPASFFVTGTFATGNPDLVKQLAAIGPVGNHTWDHPQAPQAGQRKLAAQLARTSAVIRGATGTNDRPLFRFPFGEYDSATLRTVNDAGYVAYGWTVDSLGWRGSSGGMSAQKVTRRVLAAARPGAIVLMHLGGHPTDHTTLDADALPAIIQGYRAMGYRFVTLSAS